MQVSPAFVCVGVNRVVNALDWGENGLIAYCGHRIVCIYDPDSSEVIGTLTGHKGQVNCVRWLPSSVNPTGSALLLSGAADNSIRVWAWHGQHHNPPWQCLGQLQGHESPVTSLAVQELSNGCWLLASTSSDPQLRLWHCNHGRQQQQQQIPAAATADKQQLLQTRFGAAAWHQQQPVHVGSQIQHCVALTTLPEDPDCVLMATGGTDSAIRLFVRDSSSTCSGSSDSKGAVPGVNGSWGLTSAQVGGACEQVQASRGFKLQCQLKGHENWVKGVTFTRVREETSSTATAAGAEQQQQQSGRVSLLLASAGQDRYGRIWCISTDASRRSAAEMSGAAAAGVAAVDGDASSSSDFLRSLITRYAPRPHLTAGQHTYWVTLESLLIGHEDWLHSVTWRPQQTPTAAATAAAATTAVTAAAAVIPTRSDLTLLTASQDRSMMLWAFDAPSGLWMSEAAVGDAGASCLGFYGGAFNPNGDRLVAHGFTGALHLWQQEETSSAAASAAVGGCLVVSNGSSSSSSSSKKRRLWVPRHALGGHFGAVHDISWGADGACLQSVASDQTARLFTAVKGHWFELARTQVHGHDFSCLATIPSANSSSDTSSSGSSSSSEPTLPPACLLYVSGSEEKVLRVFEAPQAFTESLSLVRGTQSAAAAAATAAALATAAARSSTPAAAAAAATAGGGRGRALGASVAALGLSNKAVYVDEEDESAGQEDESSAGQAGSRSAFGAEAYTEGPDFVPTAVPSVVQGPPLEEHLSQNTLWPEIRKLYGHGNDVFCVSASPRGSVIASACKAQSAGSAAVWVWEVGSWRALAQLSGHTLTVTQLEFAPDGSMLLSGSRDRSFSLWRVPHHYRAAVAAGSSSAEQQQQQGSPVAGAGAGDSSAAANGGFELVVRLKGAHSRIIWGVSWSHDGRLFATGSRDQTVKLWRFADAGRPQQKPLAILPPFPAGVTAVALGPQHASAATKAAMTSDPAAAEDVHLLAVGLEDGHVQVWRLVVPGRLGDDGAAQGQAVTMEQLWASQPWEQHAASVKRLRWAPACVAWLCGSHSASQAQQLHLASCGEDNSVRLFSMSC